MRQALSMFLSTHKVRVAAYMDIIILCSLNVGWILENPVCV